MEYEAKITYVMVREAEMVTSQGLLCGVSFLKILNFWLINNFAKNFKRVKTKV